MNLHFDEAIRAQRTYFLKSWMAWHVLYVGTCIFIEHTSFTTTTFTLVPHQWTSEDWYQFKRSLGDFSVEQLSNRFIEFIPLPEPMISSVLGIRSIVSLHFPDNTPTINHELRVIVKP